MSPYFSIAIIGILFILLFGGLSFIRREGVSAQFAWEVLGISAVLMGFVWLTGIPLNPVLVLIIIYLLSMRVRILVDLANMLSGRGRQKNAIQLLQFSLRLYPDRSSRLVALVNMGIVQLRRQNPASAQELFEMALQEADQGGLGIKYEAACRYNYGVALMRQGQEGAAVREFNEVTVIYPNSPFSQAAQAALQKRREQRRNSSDEA